jgi:hypothetical protein
LRREFAKLVAYTNDLEPHSIAVECPHLGEFPVLFPCWQGIWPDEAFAVRGVSEHFQARFDRREIFEKMLINLFYRVTLLRWI